MEESIKIDAKTEITLAYIFAKNLEITFLSLNSASLTAMARLNLVGTSTANFMAFVDDGETGTSARFIVNVFSGFAASDASFLLIATLQSVFIE